MRGISVKCFEILFGNCVLYRIGNDIFATDANSIVYPCLLNKDSITEHTWSNKKPITNNFEPLRVDDFCNVFKTSIIIDSTNNSDIKYFITVDGEQLDISHLVYDKQNKYFITANGEQLDILPLAYDKQNSKLKSTNEFLPINTVIIKPNAIHTPCDNDYECIKIICKRDDNGNIRTIKAYREKQLICINYFINIGDKPIFITGYCTARYLKKGTTKGNWHCYADNLHFTRTKFADGGYYSWNQFTDNEQRILNSVEYKLAKNVTYKLFENYFGLKQKDKE